MRYKITVWTPVWGDSPIPDSVTGCRAFVDADSTSEASQIATRRFPGATMIKVTPLTVAGTPAPAGFPGEVEECGTDCASVPLSCPLTRKPEPRTDIRDAARMMGLLA